MPIGIVAIQSLTRARKSVMDQIASSIATAITASPFSLPIQPSFSFVFPFTITAPVSMPSAFASLERISSRYGPIFGRSQITETSACTGVQPAARTRCSARCSISIESRPLLAGSESGNISPMSPMPAPPRIASVSACATASPSECPTSLNGAGTLTPPSRTPVPSAKRCESYPIPTRVFTAPASRRGRRGFFDDLVVLPPPARSESCLANQPFHLGDRRVIGRVRGRHHVFLEHERAEVVAAEMERGLSDLQPHRHPARLQVRDVVEHHPGEGGRAQVVHRVRLRLRAHGRGVLRLQRPADERRESSGAALEVAQALQMLEALVERFADAVHHRARSLQSLAMGNFHDFEPAIRPGLLLRDLVAHALDEDLATAAGNRVEPRLHELADHVHGRHPIQGAPEIDLTRTEAVHVDRVVLLDVAQQVEVPLERDVRIVTALDQDLHAAERLHFVDLRADLFVAERPALVVLRTTIERAEAAAGDAHGRVVDVAVDDVRDDAVGMQLPAHAVGFCTELQQRRTLEPLG